jgi:hypothetical protein
MRRILFVMLFLFIFGCSINKKLNCNNIKDISFQRIDKNLVNSKKISLSAQEIERFKTSKKKKNFIGFVYFYALMEVSYFDNSKKYYLVGGSDNDMLLKPIKNIENINISETKTSYYSVYRLKEFEAWLILNSDSINNFLLPKCRLEN